MSLGARASALIASSLACTRLAWLYLHSSEGCPHCSDSSLLIALCLRTVVCKVFVFSSCTGNPEHVFWMGGQWSGIACTGSRPHLSKAGGCKETRALNVVFLVVESAANCWGMAFLTPATSGQDVISSKTTAWQDQVSPCGLGCSLAQEGDGANVRNVAQTACTATKTSQNIPPAWAVSEG